VAGQKDAFIKQRFSFCAFVREFNSSFPFLAFVGLYLLSSPLPRLPVAISFSTLNATVDLPISLLGNPLARES